MAERGSTFWRKEKAESWFCVYRVLEKFFFKKKIIVLMWKIVKFQRFRFYVYILIIKKYKI